MEDKTVYQVNDQSIIIAQHPSVKEIADLFHVNRASFDQALRDQFKSHGFFWIFRSDWNRGVRPDFTKQIRNTEVYAYNPYRKIITAGKGEFDFNKFEFIGRYKNAVECADELEISVSNIRLVCQAKKETHKNYWFSYYPLKEEHNLLADIKEAFERDLQVKTIYGTANIDKAVIYPIPEFKFTVIANADLKEDKEFKMHTYSELRPFIVKVIDPLKKLHCRADQNLEK